MPGIQTLAEVEILGPVRCVPVPATSGSQHIIKTSGRLVGWSLRESSGSAVATVDIYDGNDANGTILAAIGLAAGASDTEHLGIEGIPLTVGCFLDTASGQVMGSVWVRVDAG